MANYMEGDYVPGKGILMPDGTYRATKPGDVGDTSGDATLGQESKSKSGDGSGSPSGIPYNSSWAAYGLTSDVWGKLNAVQQAQASIVMSSALSNYASNASSLSIPDALRQAQSDPSIISKYSDALGLDKTQLMSSLDAAQVSLSTTAQQQKQQFEKDRKALAEASASAGTAYSGFRQQAQNNLSESESGIITSTRSQAQQQLDQAKQAFEAKYGTAATPNLSLTYDNPFNNSGTSISGTYSNPTNQDTIIGSGSPTGNVIGSQNVAKSADITNLALSNIESSNPVPITPIK